MYRNCCEHPVINAILRKGELPEQTLLRYEAARSYADTEAVQIFYLSKQEYAEICLKRKQKKRPPHERSRVHSRQSAAQRV